MAPRKRASGFVKLISAGGGTAGREWSMWTGSHPISSTAPAMSASRCPAPRGAARRRVLVGVGVAAAVVVAACGDTTTQEDVDLDLDSLEAESDFGTFEAERADSSFVGAVGEGRAIGVAFVDDVGAEPSQPGAREIVVYLYDRENLALMLGEVDDDGFAVLDSAQLSDFDAAAELVMDDDVVSGKVTFLDEEPTAFVADPATGVGGVYWAVGTEVDPELSADWVVLPDERQWGCVCFPPFDSPCCHMGRW